MNFINDHVIVQLLKLIESENDRIRILDHEVKNDVIKQGNNLCSEGFQLILRYDINGKRCLKSFIVKIPSKLKSFHNELFIYESVLPKFQLLLPNEIFAPLHYLTVEKSNLILEDLSKFEYRKCDWRERLGFEHSAAALKTLAKFHAASVKVTETMTEISDYASEQMSQKWKIFLEEKRQHFQETFLKFICNAEQTYAHTYVEALSHLQKQLVSLMLKECEPKPQSLKVLNHGDFCTDNILFKYDPYGCVGNVKFVNFELCRWNSPVLDIINFTVSSVRYEIFEKYFDLLLEIYLNTLNKTLNFLKCKQIGEIDDLYERIENMPHLWIFSLVSAVPTSVGVNDRCYVETSKKWISHFIQKGILPPRIDETAIVIQTFIRIFEQKNKVPVIKYELDDDLVKVGNNFCSAILGLKIEFRNGMQTLNKRVLLKIPYLSPNYVRTLAINGFNKEIYMYEDVLPHMYEFWNGSRLNPEFYASTELKSLILEDLNETGFRTRDKIRRLDLDHSKIALRILAQFHALSLKYLEVYGVDKTKMAFVYSSTGSLMPNAQVKEYYHAFYDKFLNVISGLVSEKMYVKLTDFKKRLIESLHVALMSNEDGLNVIRHGDYWIGNILFRYNNDGLVMESKMVDFQLCCLGSPAIDLVYFIPTSLQLEVYKKHKDELLNYYLDIFNSTIKLLKLDNKYTRKDLDKDIEKYKDVFIQMISIALQLSTSGEARIAEAFETTSDIYISDCQSWLNYLEKENTF